MVNFLLSWITVHILEFQSVSNGREGYPGLSNEINNHISAQKIKENLLKVVTRKSMAGKGEDMFNFEACALDKTGLKKHTHTQNNSQTFVILHRNPACN